MQNLRIASFLVLAAGTAWSSSAIAMPIAPDVAQESMIVPVAGGCGPNGWRGPWGQCRNTPYYGRLPNGYYQTRVGNGCPPGYWRGPWGHCRNTPYHGSLPGGGWK